MFNSNAFGGKTTTTRMLSRKVMAKISLVAVLGALWILPACTIDAHDKNKDGEAHVDIKSPMGDLHVSEDADIRDAGLTLYPGAKPAPKDDGDDKKSANVNLSFGEFSLKVIAAEFVSDDAPEKLIAYYDKELKRYGKPLQCRGEWSGSGHVNASTDHDEKDTDKPVSCGSGGSGDSVELKVGTEGNQHLVSVKPNGHGTRFALVFVRMHTGKDETI
jgi:hypothetical protein